MKRLAVSRVLVVAAAGLAFLVPLAASAWVPGYSHTASYISELGALGMPQGALVSLLGFLPIGLLTIAFLVSAAPLLHAAGSARLGYWLLLSMGVSYIGAALVRCDPGCPATGSDRQAIHNLLGLLEYSGSGIGLLLFAGSADGTASARWDRAFLRCAGVVAIVALILMGTPQLASWRGLAQRVGETALFASLLLIAWRAEVWISRRADEVTPSI